MSRLKKVAEKQGNKWYAYHSSPTKNLESIKENGILANSNYLDGPSVSLGGTFEGAAEWGHLKGEGDFIVIKVELTEQDLKEIKRYTKEWNEFFEDYFLNVIAPKNDYDVTDVKEGRKDFEEFLEDVKEYEGEEYYKELENQALEKFFEEYELNLPYDIPPSQIVEIIGQIKA